MDPVSKVSRDGDTLISTLSRDFRGFVNNDHSLKSKLVSSILNTNTGLVIESFTVSWHANYTSINLKSKPMSSVPSGLLECKSVS